MVRWGVLGCASIATDVMIPGIQTSRNGRVVAVASRSQGKAFQVARRFGVPRAHGNYADLVDDPEVEAVYIPLPNSMHKEWTVRAAEKGKQVLCEKTLALNATEAEEMADSCRRYGVMLMEGFAIRFHPQNVLAKKLVAGGRIGKVLQINSMFSTPRPSPENINLRKELGGGILREKGCYCVNFPRFVLESEPTRVWSSINMGDATGVDERVTAVLEFPGGSKSFFDTSYGMRGQGCVQSWEIFGESGRIYVPRGVFQTETAAKGQLVDTSVFVARERFMLAEWTLEEIRVPGVNQWKLEAEYFADRVLSGSGLEYPAENGVANVRVMDAIYRSADEGRTIEL